MFESNLLLYSVFPPTQRPCDLDCSYGGTNRVAHTGLCLKLRSPHFPVSVYGIQPSSHLPFSSIDRFRIWEYIGCRDEGVLLFSPSQYRAESPPPSPRGPSSPSLPLPLPQRMGEGMGSLSRFPGRAFTTRRWASSSRSWTSRTSQPSRRPSSPTPSSSTPSPRSTPSSSCATGALLGPRGSHPILPLGFIPLVEGLQQAS